MKLIIDIPDEIYDDIIHGYICAEYADILIQLIPGSTPYEERPSGEWISVSERLPDKNMPCLVSVGKFNFTQIAMYSDLMETIDHKIFWQGDYGKNNFQNITEYVKAWQPLPELYKGGGADMRGDKNEIIN